MVNIPIRWADNTRDLARNLREGLDQIEATRASVDKLVKSLRGDQLAAAAHKWAAAIEEVGGVTKLTAQNQERANAIFQRFIEQQKALGAVIPSTISSLAAQTQASVNAANAAKRHREETEKNAINLGKLGEAIRLNVPLAGELSARFTENAAALGAMGAAIGGVVIGVELLRKGFDIADHIAKQASAIRDLSTETGIAIEPLQILGAATKDFGVQADELARGIFHLSGRIGANDEGANAALRVLGLNIQALKQLSPDVLFRQLVAALNGVGDQSTKAAIASELFGNKIAGAVLKIGPDFEELIAKAKRFGEFMSEDAVKGADDFGDQIEHLTAQFEALLGDAIGPTLGKLTALLELLRRPELSLLGKIALATTFDPFKSIAQSLVGAAPPPVPPIKPVASHGPDQPSPEATQSAAQAQAMANALAGLRQQLKPLTAEQNQYLQSLGALGKEFLTEKNLLATGITPGQLAVFREAFIKNQEEAKKFADSMKEVQTAIGGYGRILGALPVGPLKLFGETFGSVKEAAQALLQRGVPASDVGRALGLNDTQLKALATDLEVTKKLAELNAGATEDFGSALARLGRIDTETVSGLKDRAEVLERLHQIEAAVVGEINQAALTGAAGKVDIDTIGRLKEFFDKLKEARTELEQLSQGFAEMAQAAGGSFGAVVQDIAKVVTGFVQILRAEDAFNAAQTKAGKIAALSSGFGGLLQATSAGNPAIATGGGALAGLELGSAIGSIVPGIGTAIGAAVGAIAGGLTGLFRSAFGNAQKEINPLRQSFIDAAGGLGVLNEKAHEAGTTLDAVLNAKNPEQYKKAIDDLTKALDFQNSAMQALDDAITRYNFSLKDLGPAGASHVLSERAQQLYKDFRLLEAAGVPVDNIIKKMGKSIQQLVTDALKSGASLPAFLKPILEQMIALGRLTDASGKKITDLSSSGIQFDETVSASIQNLIDTIDQLAQAIARAFGFSLDDFKKKNKGNNPPPGPDPNPGPDPFPGKDFAPILPSGILPSSRAASVPLFGAGQRAFIASASRASNLRDVGGTTVNVTFTGPVGSFAHKQIAREIGPELVKAIAHNKDELYTRTRGALGLRS